MYVCMYIYLFISRHVDILRCKSECTYVDMYLHVYIYTYVNIYIHIYVYIYIQEALHRNVLASDLVLPEKNKNCILILCNPLDNHIPTRCSEAGLCCDKPRAILLNLFEASLVEVIIIQVCTDCRLKGLVVLLHGFGMAQKLGT